MADPTAELAAIEPLCPCPGCEAERRRFAVREEEQAGPPRRLERQPAGYQLVEARQLLSDACRCLIRSGVPLWPLVEAARGVVATLEHLTRSPGVAAIWLGGEEVEDWRREMMGLGKLRKERRR